MLQKFLKCLFNLQELITIRIGFAFKIFPRNPRKPIDQKQSISSLRHSSSVLGCVAACSQGGTCFQGEVSGYFVDIPGQPLTGCVAIQGWQPPVGEGTAVLALSASQDCETMDKKKNLSWNCRHFANFWRWAGRKKSNWGRTSDRLHWGRAGHPKQWCCRFTRICAVSTALKTFQQDAPVLLGHLFSIQATNMNKRSLNSPCVSKLTHLLPRLRHWFKDYQIRSCSIICGATTDWQSSLGILGWVGILESKR